MIVAPFRSHNRLHRALQAIMKENAIEKLIQLIKASISFTNRELEEFLSLLNYQEVKKNSVLIASGKACNKIYFLSNGYVKYQLNHGAQKKVIHIAGNGVFVSDFFSYYSDHHAITDIYTITDAQLFVASKNDLEKLYSENIVWANFGRKMSENAVVDQIMERINIQTLSAEQRYIRILKSNPELFKVIKLGDLAEILGVTQETLSRIRGRLK